MGGCAEIGAGSFGAALVAVNWMGWECVKVVIERVWKLGWGLNGWKGR